MYYVQTVMVKTPMTDSVRLCTCMKDCVCKCLDSVKNDAYEQGWLDCWQFLNSFFGTKP